MVMLEQKVVELFDRFEELAVQYTPEVIEKATAAVSVTAIGNLVGGLSGLVAVYAVWWLTKNCATYCRNKKQDGRWANDWDIGWIISFVIGGVSGGCIAIISLFELIDIWNWVAVFNPQLALAHQVLGL